MPLHRLILSLYMIAIINALAMANEIDSFEIWKTYKFNNYCDNDSVYGKVFNRFKMDFGKKPLHLSDSADQIRFQNYIQIRNAWLQIPNLNNFVMAIILTRLQLALLSIEVDLARRQESHFALSSKWDEFHSQLFLSKRNMFSKLDEIISIQNKKWIKLADWEKNDSSQLRTSGWLAYIKQAGLMYTVPFGASTMLSHGKTDSVLLTIPCVRYGLHSRNLFETIQLCSFTIDLGLGMKIRQSFLSNTTYTKEKFKTHLLENYGLQKLQWLFLCNNDPQTIILFFPAQVVRNREFDFDNPFYQSVDCTR